MSWVASVLIPCHLLPRIRAIFHNPCEAVHLSGKSCFSATTGLGPSAEESIHSLTEAFRTNGILVDTPLISFLMSVLRFKAVRLARKQGPTTMLSLLKQHVSSVLTPQAQWPLSVVCRFPLPSPAILRSILDLPQLAHVDLSIKSGQWSLA